MAIQRGSTHKLVMIRETTFGTTPTTPTMFEMPITNFSKKSTQSMLKSEQIRSHPFVDKALNGYFMHEIGIDFELQSAVHDKLLEQVFGVAIASKAAKFTDALLGMSLESQAGAGSLFDNFVGAYLNKMTITASGNDTAPVKVSTSGMAKTGLLDVGATIATAVTAAANNDPFIFSGATLTVAAASTAVVAGTINFDRVVDPLMLWGSATPREYIPGAVTASGTITVPYDDGTQSTLVEAFTSCALVFKFANSGATIYRQFTFPVAKLTSIERTINTRGGLMQVINWEALYDSSSATICTLATE